MTFSHRVNHALLRPVECPELRRLGSPNDGGYVVPIDAIRGAAVLLSFGISVDWKFERDAIAINPKIRIHAYDHTIGRQRFFKAIFKSTFSVPLRFIGGSLRGARASLNKLKTSLDYFRFFTGNVRHYQQRVWYNDDRGSASIESNIANAGSTAPQSIFAKIDIEGTEYRVLPTVLEHAELFSGLAVEFHDTDICAEIFNEQMEQLREYFEVVHVHANNYGDLSVDHTLPLSWEISFLHKKLLPGYPPRYTGPLPRPDLDTPNDPSHEDFVINLNDKA
jgi:hypothetical protein